MQQIYAWFSSGLTSQLTLNKSYPRCSLLAEKTIIRVGWKATTVTSCVPHTMAGHCSRQPISFRITTGGVVTYFSWQQVQLVLLEVEKCQLFQSANRRWQTLHIPVTPQHSCQHLATSVSISRVIITISYILENKVSLTRSKQHPSCCMRDTHQQHSAYYKRLLHWMGAKI